MEGNSKHIVGLMGENSWQMTLVCFRTLRRCYYEESGELCEAEVQAVGRQQLLGGEVLEVPTGLRSLLGQDTTETGACTAQSL